MPVLNDVELTTFASRFSSIYNRNNNPVRAVITQLNEDMLLIEQIHATQATINAALSELSERLEQVKSIVETTRGNHTPNSEALMNKLIGQRESLKKRWGKVALEAQKLEELVTVEKALVASF